MKQPILFYVFVAILFSGCSPKPYQAAQIIQKEKIKKMVKDMEVNVVPLLADSAGNLVPTAFIPTVNFGLRKPDFVIIHHTAQDSLAQTITTFTLERTQVSAHYVVSRDGKIVQMLKEELRAFHAGLSKWGNNYDMNSCSIGIELDNNGTEAFSAIQIKNLMILLAKLKVTYNIPAANFIGHADIAPKRKPDPSILFPWKTLADKGFGLWYDVPNLQPPLDFDIENALRRVGYDTRDLPAAIIAFKRHFVKLDLDPVMSDWDKCVLLNLYRKY